jgi:hypothetical protein
MKETGEKLKIANSHGCVDVRYGLPKTHMHVKGKRLQPLCRQLRIKFARALVGLEQSGSYYRPTFDGVVVSARSAPKLREAIASRKMRANSPAAIARKRQRRRANAAEAQRRASRLKTLGLPPGSRTARLLDEGVVDEGLAELMGFKARYRHEFTNYDEYFDDESFYELRSLGYSPQEAGEEMRSTARAQKQEDPLPATWPEYLEKYGFDSPVAKALAGVLQSTTNCHPTWFKEAEIAVRRAGLPLAGLTYETIKRVVARWRSEMSA